MLWLAVHFPDFGLEVAIRGVAAGKPRARDSGPQDDAPDQTPVPAARVLVHNQMVIHCNDAAAACGIRPGNSLATAQSLATSGLQYLPWHGPHVHARLGFMAEVLYRFSAEVSPEAPDAIVLEAGRSLKLFGNLGCLLTAVQDTCEALGHRVRIGSAATPLAALVLARSGATNLAEIPLHCLAVGLQPVHTGPGDKPAKSRQAGSRLPNRMIERLGNMGLTRLGQVRSLPRSELAHRFGHEFANYLARLDGQIPDPRATILPPDRFDHSLHLLEPIRDKAALEAPMQHLLDELGQWLTAHQFGAEALVWCFSAHASHNRACMPVRFARAQQQPRAFLGISMLKLAETPLPEDVLSISLKARRLRPWVACPGNLFPDALLPDTTTGSTGDFSGESTACTELLDRLGARLGETACVRLEAIDCHTPEEAWQTLPVTARPARQPVPVPPGRRPLWLFSPPRPVNVDEFVLQEGPERIQGQWWNNPVSRDYYIATHRNGARCWVFVDLEQEWYLHGYFA